MHVIKFTVFKPYVPVNEKLKIYFIHSAKTILKGTANLASKLVSNKYILKQINRTHIAILCFTSVDLP